MFKRPIVIISIVSIFFLLIIAGWFLIAKDRITQLNTVNVCYNGSPILIDTIFDKGVVYVPVEQICYYMKCGFEKESLKKTVNFIKNGQVPDKTKNSDIRTIKIFIKVKDSGYKSMIDGLHLSIKPVVYDNQLYIDLKHLAQSFKMDTRWGFLKNLVRVEDYPAKFMGPSRTHRIAFGS